MRNNISDTWFNQPILQVEKIAILFSSIVSLKPLIDANIVEAPRID
jgi:hypothetical protein